MSPVRNPVREWLVRVAVECGSPANMLRAAAAVHNENTRRLLVAHAELWKRQRSAENMITGTVTA